MGNLNEYAYLFIMSITSIVVLFFISKILGKKQIAQLEFIDYVMGISIGSIAAEMATDTGEKPIEYYIIAIVLFFLFDIAVSFLGRKSPFLKHIFKGRPITIIYDGKIDYDALKRSKLDVNDVIGLCREQGYFDISCIAFAVFENSGNLSVMPVGGSAPITLDTLTAADGLVTAANSLGTTAKLPFYMIVDGRISFSSLSELDKDAPWLFSKLNVETIDLPSETKLARCSKFSCLPIKQLKNIILAIYNPDTDEMKITYKKPM